GPSPVPRSYLTLSRSAAQSGGGRVESGRTRWPRGGRRREAQLLGQVRERGREMRPELRKAEVQGVRIGPPGPLQLPSFVPETREVERRFGFVGGKVKALARLDGRLERSLRILPLCPALGDQTAVQLHLFSPEHVREVFEQVTRLLVVPFGILELAQVEVHLHTRQKRAPDRPAVARPLGHLPRLLQVLEAVLGTGFAHEHTEIVVRPRQLDPVARAEQ